MKCKHGLKNNRGQGLVEYIVLVALIAVGSIAVVRTVGQNVAKQYENINIALGAETRNGRPTLNASPKAALEKRDLGNFLKGAVSADADEK